jgi:hypothetical protein
MSDKNKKEVYSIRNELVDFDVFEIKKQISEAPKSSDVLMREKYVDIKRKRSPRKRIEKLVAEQDKNKLMVRTRLKNKQNIQYQEELNNQYDLIDNNEVLDDQNMEFSNQLDEPIEEIVEEKPKRKRRVKK